MLSAATAVALAASIACTNPAWLACQADNVFERRVALRDCAQEEFQRVTDCIEDAQTELAACHDDLPVCLGAARTVEQNCRADKADYRACRALVFDYLDQIDAICNDAYPCN